jgi:nondiscriminating aspartyl-tRNA synthetase
MMVGSGLERVFEVGHAYRAEKSETSRHLTEYVSLDFEMGFIEDVADVMDMHEALVWSVVEAVCAQCNNILRRRNRHLPEAKPIPRISFPEAVTILAKRFGKTEGLAGDLDTEGERLIGRWAEEEHGSAFVFVTGYHVDRRPLYTMPDLDHPPLTHSFDLLMHGVEVTTGGQRIHGHDQLVAGMRAQGLNLEDYSGYLEAFRHGMPPHGGMGMGIERLLMQMLGLTNVRSASLFPRDRSRMTP